MKLFANIAVHSLVACEQQFSAIHRSFLRRCGVEGCTGVVVLILSLCPVFAEESPVSTEMLPPPAIETPAPTATNVDPVIIDPFIMLRGSVWRTKAGIVFLKTPVGLLTLTSKTTLKDL